MRKVSFSDVFGLQHAPFEGEPPQVGDMVATGPNDAPQYQVLAIVEDKAWLRGARGGDHIVPLSRLRKLES